MLKKTSFKLCRITKSPLTKTLKSHSAIFGILFAATILIVSFSVISSAKLSGHATACTTEPQILVQASQNLTSSTESMQLPEYEPRFNVDIAYAFVGNLTSEEPHSHFDGVPHYPESKYPSAVYFNVTRAAGVEIECDALIEVYFIQIISDKGPIENYAYFEGTNYEPSFSEFSLESLTAHVYDLIDLNTVSGVSGHFRFNWTSTDSIVGGKVGSFGSYSSNPTGLGLWSAGKPNMISVTIRRTGSITINDSYISVHVDPTSANKSIQLPTFGDCFLYNKAMPFNELLQKDLFQPLS
jgi:hypothetical protein